MSVEGPPHDTPLQRSETAASATSAASSQPPLSRVSSPATTLSDGQRAGSISQIGTCGRCQRGILSSDPLVRCLVCSTTGKPSVIGNVCSQCYQIGVYGTAHTHDKTYLSSDTDPTVKDAGLPENIWEVKRNAYQRQWYIHVGTKFRTHIKPMTAVCGLPTGWEAVRDQSGKLLYRDPAGQLTLQHPNGLPDGWREAKDPNGKPFYVHDRLQLASWHRPDESPAVQEPSTAKPQPHAPQPTASIQGQIPVPDPSVRPHPARIQTAPPPAVNNAQNIQRPQTSLALQTIPIALPRPTLRTATEATVNLLDPSHGSVLRQSRIAGHIAGQGILSSVNAIKRNKPLQDFARGTGIALANRKVKRAWRKAAAEVDLAYGAGRTQRVEITVNNAGPSSATGAQAGIIEEADDGYNGEYEVEYDDGTVVQFGADGKPLRVVTRSTPASSVTSPVAGPTSPPLSRVSTGSSIPLEAGARRASMPARRPVAQLQQSAAQQQQMLRIQMQQQQLQAQQQELQRHLIVAQTQQQQEVIYAQPATQTIVMPEQVFVPTQPVYMDTAIGSGVAAVPYDPYSAPPQYVDLQPGPTLADGVNTLSLDSDGASSDGGLGVFDVLSS